MKIMNKMQNIVMAEEDSTDHIFWIDPCILLVQSQRRSNVLLGNEWDIFVHVQYYDIIL